MAIHSASKCGRGDGPLAVSKRGGPLLYGSDFTALARTTRPTDSSMSQRATRVLLHEPIGSRSTGVSRWQILSVETLVAQQPRGLRRCAGTTPERPQTSEAHKLQTGLDGSPNSIRDDAHVGDHETGRSGYGEQSGIAAIVAAAPVARTAPTTAPRTNQRPA